MTRKRQPFQCMCVESGALRPSFFIPTTPPVRQEGVLGNAFLLHLLSGINSEHAATRNYWRTKFPETSKLWRRKL